MKLKFKYDPQKLCYNSISWWKDNKKVIVSVGVTSFMFCIWIIYLKVNPTIQIVEKHTTSTIIIPDSSDSNLKPHDQLVEALIFVESSGRDSVVNSVSGATGCLQLLPIMVREVNRILEITGNKDRYTLDDRYSRVKSVEMFHIWRLYHHKNHSYEVIARNWNGGPRGYLMSATYPYWIKVRSRMNEIKL